MPESPSPFFLSAGMHASPTVLAKDAEEKEEEAEAGIGMPVDAGANPSEDGWPFEEAVTACLGYCAARRCKLASAGAQQIKIPRERHPVSSQSQCLALPPPAEAERKAVL